MPIKTNIGICRKVADNNYGSHGASVNLEIELDSGLIQEPERLQERIRQVFRVAQQSVDEELTRQQQASDAGIHAPNTGTNGQTASPAHNGAGASNNYANGNGSNGNGHGASEKQLAFARQLAKAIQGLGIRRLETLAQRMFGKPLAAMNSMDASGLIDTLKSVKDGKIDLNSIVSRAAA